MKKYLKFIVPAVCVIVVAVAFFMIYDLNKKVEERDAKMANTVETSVSNTTTEDSNTVTNTTTDQETETSSNELVTVTNTSSTNTTTSTTTSEESELTDEETDVLSATNQASAVELVEEYWGEDDTVYFTNEGANSDGEQIVAVRSKSSTVVKQYFRVNLSTGEVELEF